ncbi:MAG: helix-turn-helix domain-containing protein [Coriobacteriia bacterium]|nr:helix-turn-helix domain-containing protein [Coriobacteriia bacterium]
MSKEGSLPPGKLRKTPGYSTGDSMSPISSLPPDDIALDRLMPISQFSRSTGISRSALIYYDETGVLHPNKRDPKNNYRYYRPEQIITANLIKVLAELNIPLKQIKALSTQRSSASMLQLFNEHEDALQAHIKQLEQSVQLIEVFRDLLKMGKDADESEIAIRTLPGWNILIGPACEPFSEEGNFYQQFLEFTAWAQEQGYSTSFPIGGYFSSFESFRAHPGEPDNFFLLLSTRSKTRTALKVLTAYSRGFYGHTGDIAERMAQMLEEKKLKPKGRLLCTYIEDEISTIDPSRYLMQATLNVG